MQANIQAFYERYKNFKVLTDSRKWASAKDTFFVAIQGERHDGHVFLKDLYQRGFRHFVVQNNTENEFLDATLERTTESLHFLQELAAYKRGQMHCPVVGITGSNGKTIVKEWLAQLLMPYRAVVKSPKSYNSQLGVAISVWEMADYHEVGIFEAGISKAQEMQRLEHIIKPTIGIFTNIGSAHDEGFECRQEKISEKARLFKNCRKIIYSSDYQDLQELLSLNFEAERLVAWSFEQNDGLHIETSSLPNDSTLIKHPDIGDFQLPFQDKSSLENAVHAILAALELGLSAKEIQQSLTFLRRLDMRLGLKEGIAQSLLIDDAYSNDLSSLPVALDFMNEQAADRGHRIAILSQPLQMGLDSEILSLETQKIALEKGISELWYIAENIPKTTQQLLPTRFFIDTDSVLEALAQEPINQSYAFLVKGARKYALERVIKALEAKQHGTVLEISLEAVLHNLNFYKRQLKTPCKLMVMVKALAYGSGYKEIAKLAAYNGVHYLAVAYTDEGAFLRQQGIQLPIMIMNPEQESFKALLDHNLEPEIYSFRLLKSWIQFIQNQNITEVPALHLKVDTGMRRLGFEPEELPSVAHLLMATSLPLYVASIFTHLAASESAEHDVFTSNQFQKFLSATSSFSQKIGYQPLRHILNSAGILRYPEAHLDMVRLGMGLYGVETANLHSREVRPISTLKARISQIKMLKKGETVGYGRRGRSEQDTRIATISIGYADGYDRRFGLGNGQMLINGHSVSTIGSICMDMCMVLLGDVPAKEGDEVIVFGEELPIQRLAEQIGTIPYEILTNVGPRVRRVFYW